ncbi:MAG: hypothetical protein AAB919_03580, partial [Patescibacteria group bacterium]
MKFTQKIKTADGKTILSARKVAARLHCAPDYVSKLCREGKLKGELIDQAWFVEPKSIAAFEAARESSRLARSEELSHQRREELSDNGFVPKTASLARKVPLSSTAALASMAPMAFGVSTMSFAKTALACAAVGAALLGSVALTHALPAAQPEQAAAVAQLNSPFFGAQMPKVSGDGSFFSWVASLFAPRPSSTIAQKTAPVSSLPPPQTFPATTASSTPAVAASSSPRVVNNYPVTERVVERVIASQGVSENLLAQKLEELSNALTSKIYQISSQTSGNATVQYAPSQRIDQLRNVTITNATLVGGTIDGYLPLGGGTLSGALNNTTTATSTFAGGLALTGGCLSVNGACIGNGTFSGSINLVSQVTGVLATSSGGTGTSTAPSYGQMLVGNSAGGYDLLATSSLGITAGGTGFSTTSAIYFVNASTTIPKTYTSNTFTGENTFTSSTTLQNFTALQSTSTNATSTSFFATTLSATGLVVSSGVQLSALGNCTLKTDSSGVVTCGTDLQGSGSANDWTFFNGSGERLATTSNQLLLGASATTSLAALEVIRQGTSPAAYFSGNVGIGTTSPYAALSVVGEIVGAYLTGTTTATSTLGGGLQARALNITSSTASSTFANGINLAAGCFSINGVCVSGSGGSGTPGGSNTQVQFNSAGSFGGSASFTFNNTTGQATVTGLIATNATTTNATTTSFAVTGLATTTISGGLNVAVSAGCLAINGSCLSAGSLTNYWTSSGSTLYNNTGTIVGINNATPSYTLDVGGFINTDQYSGFKQAGATILSASSTNFATLVGSGAGSNTLVTYLGQFG